MWYYPVSTESKRADNQEEEATVLGMNCFNKALQCYSYLICTCKLRPPFFAWAGATQVGGGGGPAPAFAEPGWVGVKCAGTQKWVGEQEDAIQKEAGSRRAGVSQPKV